MLLPQGISGPVGTGRCFVEIKATIQARDFVQFSRLALNVVSSSFHLASPCGYTAFVPPTESPCKLLNTNGSKKRGNS